MSTTPSSSAFAAPQQRPRPDRTDPVIRRRRLSALALTVATIALGIALVAAFGRDALPIYFFHLPVALVLLWMSTNEERFDERPEGAGGRGRAGASGPSDW